MIARTMPKKLMTLLVFGFAFLYVPILSLIVFSFNESRLVTVWTRFSFKWYAELFQDQQILNAVVVSLKIAFFSACLAVILGTLAALVLVRFKKLKGRSFLNAMVTAPLVMPDVIMGLALLLFFVGLEQFFGFTQGRGLSVITIAHATLAMAYVTVIVRARLLDFDTSFEEAALDLGARPARVFLSITLPLITPSLVAGWLLAFTLSLDDVVIASFIAGPGATTLPMVVFSSVRMGVSPHINALATIIVLIVTMGVVAAGFFMRRTEKLKAQKNYATMLEQ